MLGQQRVGSRWPLVRLPRLLLQAAADGLAIEIQPTGDLGDREQLLAGHPVDLPPAVFQDHAFLLEATCLGSHGASFTNNGFLHPEPPRRVGSGGDFSTPTGGELCMPDDTSPPLRVTLTHVQMMPGCTVALGEGLDSCGRAVSFAGDWRPMLALGEAL